MTAPSDVTMVEQVKAAHAERCKAMTENDIAALERLHAPDCTIVRVSGTIQRRDEFMASMATIQRNTTPLSADVRLFGEVAVSTSIVLNKTRTGDQNRRGSEISETMVWVKNNNQWQVVACHTTHIEEPK